MGRVVSKLSRLLFWNGGVSGNFDFLGNEDAIFERLFGKITSCHLSIHCPPHHTFDIHHLIWFLYYRKELDLSRNQLRGFDDELVDKLLSIESVKFDHNPFVCDLCNMVAILERQQEVRYFKLAAAFNN